MRLSATAGCQRSWLLKSRSTPQTRIDRRVDDGAAADLNHLPPLGNGPGSASGKLALQRVEAALEHAIADAIGQRLRPCRASQSNSALHSAKLRLPSVIGVSFRVAM